MREIRGGASRLYLGIFNIVEGICGKSPLKKCGTSPKIRVPQMLKSFKYAHFGNHSNPPSVSKCTC